MTGPSPSWYVDRSIPNHAVVTVAARPSVRRCLAATVTGQLQPFEQRQVVNTGLSRGISLPVAGGIGVALFGGVAAATVLPFPFSLIAAGIMFGLVVAGHRVFDAASVHWSSPDMANGGSVLYEYAQMASAEVRRKESLYRDHAPSEGVVRYEPDLWFPSRTVWAMKESGNGVAQFAAQRLRLEQFDANGVTTDAFEEARYEAWQACAEARKGRLTCVLEVEGSAHAVFGGALQELADEDLVELASLVVERHEVEERLAALTGKIERAKATGADSDYPEVAGATVEAEVLREQAERIEALYQDRLAVAQNDAELSRLTEREKRKADRQERTLRDLTDPPHGG